MPVRKALIALGVLGTLLVALLIVDLSSLLDASSGWESTLGDIVRIAVFVTVAALVVLGVVALLQARSAPGDDAR